MTAPFVLVVEDNPADADVIAETLRSWRSDIAIEVARDGERALDVLLRRGSFSDRMPNLIILDLNLPKLCGREVLNAVRGVADLRHIPVLVLTSSADEREAVTMYQQGANAYLVKPMHHGDFVQLLNTLSAFWLSTAMLPA